MTVKIDGTNTVANPAFTGADTDTGLQCGTNEVKLVTGGTARATVNSSGNVAIGATVASTRLDVEGDGVPVEINSANGNSNKVQLSDAGTVRGYFGASSTASFLVSGDGGSEQIRVQAAGGISFNGDTGAVNALDDYEEGTFSPFSSTQISDHSITIPAQAHYVKIGRLVQIWMRVQYTGTSSASITGNMPFPCSNPTNSASVSPFFLSVFPKSGSSTNMLFAYLGANNTTGFTIYEVNNNYGTLAFNDTPAEITITGCYRTT